MFRFQENTRAGKGDWMFRISLKWFLIVTAATGTLIGTVGKRAWDHWHQSRWLAAQRRVAAELDAAKCGVVLRDGVVVEAHFGHRTGAAKAMSLLQYATNLEKLRAECPLNDADLSLLQGHSKLRELCVHGHNSGITDISLHMIGQFRHLETLCLFGTAITDDGLAELASLKELRCLDLGSAPILGHGIKHLAPLPNLEVVSLRGSSVLDDGLAELAKCSGLKNIYLDGTTISGHGLAHFSQLPNLRTLGLSSTSLRDGQGLAALDQVESLDLSDARLAPGVLSNLAEMKGLRKVNLFQAQITDDMLEELKEAKQIEELSLMRTSITDAGLVHLRRLKNLKTLNLGYTGVTGNGAQELGRYLGNTTIYYIEKDGNHTSVIPGSAWMRNAVPDLDPDADGPNND